MGIELKHKKTGATINVSDYSLSSTELRIKATGVIRQTIDELRSFLDNFNEFGENLVVLDGDQTIVVDGAHTRYDYEVCFHVRKKPITDKEKMAAFLDCHEFEDGYEWAMENCASLQEVWDTARPDWLVWLATREGVLTDRELHEFSLWAANQVKHLMSDKRSLEALLMKRLWLDGMVTDEELKIAWNAAWEAARCSSDPAALAARDTARADSSWVSSWETAKAAIAAISDGAANYADVWLAAWVPQAQWLRENTKPNWIKRKWN